MTKVLLGRLGKKAPDYSIMDKKIRKLIIPIDGDRSTKAYEHTIDSTGFKIANKRKWLNRK